MERGLKIVIAFLLAVALVAGGYLAVYFYSLSRAADEFDDLAEIFRDEPPQKEPAAERMDGFEELRAQNDDLAGWLTVRGTAIDYPVMYTPEDPHYYLQRNFERQYSVSGTLFIDERCSLEPRSDNLIIHGHNMKDGSMFAGLLRYEDEAFWRRHRRLEYYAFGEKQVYVVFAALRTAADNQPPAFNCFYFINSHDEDEFNAFVAAAKADALYETGVTPAYGEPLLMLSTCAYHAAEGRFVVMARALQNECV